MDGGPGGSRVLGAGTIELTFLRRMTVLSCLAYASAHVLALIVATNVGVLGIEAVNWLFTGSGNGWLLSNLPWTDHPKVAATTVVAVVLGLTGWLAAVD